MPSSDPSARNRDVFRLDEWRIAPALNRIERAGKTVQLEPRAMMVLCFLASTPHEVFSRTEIMSAVWDDSIVNDEALTRIISLLRQALDDDPKRPRYIETIYKRGYRLLVAPAPLAADPEPSPQQPGSFRRLRLAALVLAAFVLLIAALVGSRFLGPDPVRTDVWAASWIQKPLTTYPGPEFSPAISPDGSRVAFVMSESAAAPGRIWIKEIAGDSTYVLPTRPGYPTQMAWAPDNRQIAYVNYEERTVIRSISLAGGEDRELYRGEFALSGLAWSPDGDRLAVSMSDADPGRSRIHLIHLDDLMVEQLTSAPLSVSGDFLPVFSPDGRQLAFGRGQRDFFLRVHVLSLIDGSTELLEPEFGYMTGLDWAPNGRQLLVTSYPEETGVLQGYDLQIGRLETLSVGASNVEWVSCARTADRMVIADMRYDVDILSVELVDVANPTLNPVGFNSTRRDQDPVYSPDGRNVAFISGRSGHPEIWVQGSDGNAPRRLTRFAGPDLTNLRWSPDGRSVAATSIAPECTRVEIVGLDGDSAIVSAAECRDYCSAWSSDGTWLYVQSDRSGEETTWRVKPDGSAAEAVLPHAGVVLGDRPSNGNLVFLQRRRAGIWERDLRNGAEHELVSPTLSRRWYRRRLQGERIYFAEGRDASTTLGYFDLLSHTRHDLVELPVVGQLWFTVAPDGSHLLVAVPSSQGSDLILLESPEGP